MLDTYNRRNHIEIIEEMEPAIIQVPFLLISSIQKNRINDS